MALKDQVDGPVRIGDGRDLHPHPVGAEID